MCLQEDPDLCVTCNSQFYMSAPNNCTQCRLSLPHCLSCDDGSTCDQCDVGYYFDGSSCELCG